MNDRDKRKVLLIGFDRILADIVREICGHCRFTYLPSNSFDYNYRSGSRIIEQHGLVVIAPDPKFYMPRFTYGRADSYDPVNPYIPAIFETLMTPLIIQKEVVRKTLMFCPKDIESNERPPGISQAEKLHTDMEKEIWGKFVFRKLILQKYPLAMTGGRIYAEYFSNRRFYEDPFMQPTVVNDLPHKGTTPEKWDWPEKYEDGEIIPYQYSLIGSQKDAAPKNQGKKGAAENSIEGKEEIYPKGFSVRVQEKKLVVHPYTDSKDDLIETISGFIDEHTMKDSKFNFRTIVASLYSKNPSMQFPIIGESSAIERLFRQIYTASLDPDGHVILIGETGTGKELVSKILHTCSFRKSCTSCYAAANAAMLQENLIESILFGTKKWAYTYAVDREGLISEADGGTFFLDEIQSLCRKGFDMLLRFMDSGEYRILGENKDRKARVRLVVATNSDDFMHNPMLHASGFIPRFRHIIKLPPIRFRENDIHLLAEHFLSQIKSDFEKKYPLSKDITLPRDIMTDMESLSWENSNVRGIQTSISNYFFHRLAGISLESADGKTTSIEISDSPYLKDEPVLKIPDGNTSTPIPTCIPTHVPGPKGARMSDEALVKALEASQEKIYRELSIEHKGKALYKDPKSMLERIKRIGESSLRERANNAFKCIMDKH